MGGGSSINVQAANRGLPRDFDEWAALGATGLPFHLDQNGEFGDGLFPSAFSNLDDRRVSTAAGYLTVVSLGVV